MPKSKPAAKRKPEGPTDTERLDWMEQELNDHIRSKSVEMRARTFPYTGLQFKCGCGPWRGTLREAIDAAMRAERRKR